MMCPLAAQAFSDAPEAVLSILAGTLGNFTGLPPG